MRTPTLALCLSITACSGTAPTEATDPAPVAAAPLFDAGAAAEADADADADASADAGATPLAALSDPADAIMDVAPAVDASSAARANAPEGDGCTLVTHSNGVGGTWQDCIALDTFTQAEAMAACGVAARNAGTDAGACVWDERCPQHDADGQAYMPERGAFLGSGDAQHAWIVDGNPAFVRPGIVLKGINGGCAPWASDVVGFWN